MIDIQEQFYNELTTELSANDMSIEQIKVVQNVLMVLFKKYSIQTRELSLTVIDKIPTCVKNYLAIRKIDGVAMSTLKLYGLVLKNFFKSVDIPIEKITINDIRRYLWEYQNKSGCGNRTLDSERSIISTFFHWATSEGYLQTDPCTSLKPIKYESKKRGHLSDMEIEKMRSVIEDVRTKAVFETLLSTGCRVKELVGIKISDIDFEKKEVTLLGKGNKVRTSYLNSKSILAIRSYLETRKDSVDSLFVSVNEPHPPVSKRWAERVIHDLGVSAGIKQNVYPHLLRHTTATMAMNKGMPAQEVQKLLGHSNIATTMIYADVLEENLQIDHKKYIS